MNNPFEIVGYRIDYYIRGKYIGSERTDKPDRDVMGYQGRTTFNLPADIILKKKKYKMGTEVTTECMILCGKYIGTQEDKINAMLNSRIPYAKI